VVEEIRRPAESALERRLDAALPPAGYHCLHGVAGRQEAGVAVDHLVIGPGGAFVILEEELADEVRAGADGRIWCGGRTLEDGIDRVLERATTTGRLIGSHATGVMAINGAVVKAPSVVRTVHLAPAQAVPSLVERRGGYLNPTQIERFAARAGSELTVRSWTQPARATRGTPPPRSGRDRGPLGRLLRRSAR
jgi:hypothetical protein